MTERVRFNGWESTERREKIVEGGFYVVLPDGKLLQGKPYAPKGITYLMKMPVAFEVETMEGVVNGKAGDYLAVGLKGEMYPVRAAMVPIRFDEVVDVDFV